MKRLFYFLACVFIGNPLFEFGQSYDDGHNNLSDEADVSINPLNPAEIFKLGGLCYTSKDTGQGWSISADSYAEVRSYESASVFWYKNYPMFTCISGADSLTVYKLSKEKSERVYQKRLSVGKRIKSLSVFQSIQDSALHAVWSQLDEEESKNSKPHSYIFYSRGNLDGNEWTEPERISLYDGNCSNSDSTLMGAVCCTGPANEVYCAWAGPQGLMFRNLSDKKIKSEKVVAPFVNGWKYVVTRNTNATGLPSIVCDNSNSAYRGRIYLCWSDEKHGVHNKNVFVIYSDDQGENWTEPIVVTYRPNHKEQFMPVMCIDQTNGYLSIVYYDQQNYSEGDFSDLYLAQSRNGGLKYDYYKINRWPLKPDPSKGFGKSPGLSVSNRLICAAWINYADHTATDTRVFNENTLNHYKKKYSEEIQINKTFNFSDKININFVFDTPSKVTAVITKPLEAGFEKLVVRSKNMEKGNNSILVDTKKLGLEKGNYTLTLYHHGKNTFVWLLDE